MCEPISASTAFYASMAFSALTTGVQYMAQQQAANAENDFNAQQQAQGEANAKSALIFNQNQETSKALEQQQADSFETQRIHRERLQKQGTAVSSVQSQGTSIDQLMAEYDQQEANYRSALKQEAEFKKRQSQANMQGYAAQYKDRVASYAYNPVSGPSLAGAVAGLGTQAVGAYATFNSQKPKETN